MAVTGKFVADFTSFETAVAKARVSLDTLEVNSSKVQASLQRMATSFTGQKLIQDAQLVTRAVEEAGGAAVLTEKEMRAVNAQVTQAIEKYKLLGKEAPKAMTDLADATKQVEQPALTKWFSDLGSSIAGTAAGFISAQAVIGGVQAALGGLVDFLKGSVESFLSAEAAEKKMTAALRSMGLAAPETIAALNDLAGQFQETTTYSDDLISEMEALLIQVGGVAPHEMEKALTAATDLAAGLGVDLEAATKAVAKAFAGNAGALGEYGIKLDEARLKTEGVAYVLDEVADKFGGQAAAATETYAGKVAQLANEWDNLKEAVGKLIVDNPTVVGVLRDLTTLIRGGDDALNEWIDTWKEFAGLAFLPPALKNALDELNDYYQKANEAAALHRQINEQLKTPPPSFGARPDTSAADQLARSKQVVAETIAGWKEEDVARKDRERAAEQHAEKMRQLTADLFGGSARALARDYVTAIGSVENVNKLGAESTTRTIEALTAGIRAYREIGETAPQAMTDLLDATLSWNAMVNPTIETVQDFGGALKALDVPMQDFGRWLKLTPPGINAAGKEAQDFGHRMLQWDPALQLAQVNLAQLSSALGTLASVAPGAFGAVAGGLNTMLNATKGIKESFGGIKDAVGAFKQGQSLAGLTSLASGITGVISAAMMAVQGIKAIWNAFDNNKGRDAVEKFAESWGGFDALHAKLLEMGETGEQLWIKLTQGTGQNNPEQAARNIAEVEDAIRRHEEAARDAGEATEEEAQATIETATEAAQALDELAPKIQANVEEWRKWSDQVTAFLQSVADNIRSLPMPAVLPAPTAAGLTAPATSEGGGGTAVISVDGRTLAEVTVPHIPGVVKRYGLA